MQRKPLVIGIDPGTTLGYAILNLDGEIKKLKSRKGLNLDSLISTVVKEGKVLVVGTDKNPVPSFVKGFCQKTGAKLIFPDEDLRVKEKRNLIKMKKTKNKHERDALAAALFAHKKIKRLLKKIDIFLKKANKEEFSDEIKELLLKKEGFNRERALKFLRE